MALRKKQKKSLKKIGKNKIIDFLFNQKALPFTLTLALLGALFVGFRMKGIEQAYVLNNLKKQMDKVTIRNKELKAQRAKSMSVQKLRSFATKFDLKEPGPEQIIHIP